MSRWKEIEIQPLDVALHVPEKTRVGYVTQQGPVGQILQEALEVTRERGIEGYAPLFEPYVHGAEVLFTAACWMVTALA